MSITRTVMDTGGYQVQLRDDTPRNGVLDKLRMDDNAFASIIFTPAWLDPAGIDDSTILKLSVFTGVHRQRRNLRELKGPHATAWLADDQNNGPLNEVTVNTTAGFSTWVGSVRPSTLAAGTVYAVSGSLAWSYDWSNDQNFDPRSAMEAICDYFTVAAAAPVEYEVGNDLKLNAGKVADLYAATRSVILSEFAQGREGSEVLGIPCTMDVDENVDDYTTRVLVEDSGGNLGAYGPASTPPFKDARGNTLAQKRKVSGVDSGFSGNLNTVAQGQYQRLAEKTTKIDVRTRAWCPLKDIRVGQYVAVWAPMRDVWLAFLPIDYRGDLTWPVFLRVMSLTQPVQAGMGVYLRYWDGAAFSLLDLTPWVVFEQGESTIEVGQLDRKLSRSLKTVGTRRLWA